MVAIPDNADAQVEANGHQYFAFTSAKKTFDVAKADCESRGQVLATLCSEEELLALRFVLGSILQNTLTI